MKTMAIPDVPTPQKRVYSALRGVDLVSIPAQMSLSRSPDAMNVWKDYSDTAGRAIETRLGFKTKGTFNDTIYGIHRFGDAVYIHCGSRLILWSSSEPDVVPATETVFATQLNTAESISVEFNGYLYILDGHSLWRFDGNTCVQLSDTSLDVYIPTTRINADPNGGNGEEYQEVNMLSAFRINTFCGDGTSTVFYLDDTDIDTQFPIVTVNGNSVSVAECDYTNGTVTLTNAPPAPATLGEANVSIRYRKRIVANRSLIRECTNMVVFDQRIFFTGNPSKKGFMWHSALNDPTYIPDTNYYHDGNDDTPIIGLLAGNNSLVVIKGIGGSGQKVFIHTPTLDYTYGKVYPYTSTGITVGGYVASLFKDEMLYLTDGGVESFTSSARSTANLYHKSTLVDKKLANDDIRNADMKEWRGYMCILIGDTMYLADSRQTTNDFGTYEYEWYLWDSLKVGSEQGKKLFVYNDALYFYTEHNICKFEGTNDNGNAIYSYWTTPKDIFGYSAYLKTVNKKGGSCFIKPVPNSKLKIACITTRQTDAPIAEYITSGFSFSNISFNNFSFATEATDLHFFRVKKKKISWFMLKFYSDELDTPFGLYEATLEYVVTKYAKEL